MSKSDVWSILAVLFLWYSLFNKWEFSKKDKFYWLGLLSLFMAIFHGIIGR